MNYPSFNQWTTDNLAMASPKDQVSASDLNSLLKGRRFNQTDVSGVDMCPSIPAYDPEEMRELEEYCKKKGIVGINFSGMSPRLALKMLKGRTEGIYTETTKKGILHG